MKNYLYALCVMAAVFSGCKKESIQFSKAKALISFSFQAENNPELIANDLLADIGDTTVIAAQGSNNDKTALVANFTFQGSAVVVNGVPQVSGETPNDFSKPVTYDVYAEDGSKRSYTVKLKSFTAIPILYITTESPVVSKDVYVNGTMKIDGNMEYFDGLYDGKITIKGRGNSTWFQPKKPYKIKLPNKAKILGMPADKEWALLANYFDKSLIRNKVGFELSSRFNMTYTPRSRFVEVFMNGEYLGNYQLIETIKVSKDRLDIDAMDVNNPLDSTGGFLAQVDSRLDGTTVWRSPRDVPFVLETPEVLPAANLQYIQNFISKIEDKIYSYGFDPQTGYAADLDIDKFVDWYLLNEIMLPADAAFYSSVYMYRDRNGKLSMGPQWDMDLSSGNVNYSHPSPEGWMLKVSSWIVMLVRDPNFMQKVKTRWNQLKPSIMTIPAYIDQQEAYLKYSQKENFKKWDILSTWINPNQVVTGSYAGEVAYFKDWITQRINWMDAELNK